MDSRVRAKGFDLRDPSAGVHVHLDLACRHLSSPDLDTRRGNSTLFVRHDDVQHQAEEGRKEDRAGAVTPSREETTWTFSWVSWSAQAWLW